ncbi:MAG: hypothetical protein ACD_56C00017G0006 [uncultured bacterium]|nr:MAG: hypothetical protein ACD_56C00017G0006 [uncultured bacterium]
MKIFIDFDDVIFNTKKFNLYLRDFYDLHGIDQELIQKHYYDPDDNSKVKLFDSEGLFSRLEKYEKINTKNLRENFTEYIKDLSSFIFDDVENFLIGVGRENVYLVSFGLPVFQNEKITGAGINKLVSGCIVTRGLKSEAVQQVITKMNIDHKEKMIFIDDRVEHVEDIKKVFHDMTTLFLCRKEGRYCDQKNEYCDHEVHNLKEAQEIISKMK